MAGEIDDLRIRSRIRPAKLQASGLGPDLTHPPLAVTMSATKGRRE